MSGWDLRACLCPLGNEGGTRLATKALRCSAPREVQSRHWSARSQPHLRRPRLHGRDGPCKRPSPCFGGTMGPCQAAAPLPGLCRKSLRSVHRRKDTQGPCLSLPMCFLLFSGSCFHVYMFHPPERSDRLLTPLLRLILLLPVPSPSLHCIQSSLFATNQTRF